jgi:hypothetical protein
VKNDGLDAAALHQRRDCDERENKKAFSTVRIPTVDKDRERQRFAVMGRRRQRYLVDTTTADTGRARSPLSSLSVSSDAKP